MTGLYLEDLSIGQTFTSSRLRVTADDIKAFAAQFDPQPFHLDEEAAKASVFGGLAASGWHTAALTMRLLLSGPLTLVGGSIGAGVDMIQWPRPVRPGDELHAVSEVIEMRPSRTKPERGMIKVRTTTFNQAGEPVQIFVANMLTVRRPAG